MPAEENGTLDWNLEEIYVGPCVVGIRTFLLNRW